MNILAVNSANTSVNPTFKASINGIKLPKNTEKEIKKLEKACEVLIGRDQHLSETPVGTKTAFYSKYSRSFDIPISDASVDVVTYQNKIHSVHAVNVEDVKGKKIVKSFYLYNGCKGAVDPIPTINYSEHEARKPLSGFDHYYKSGSEIDSKNGKLIEKLVSLISEKLGI